MNSNDQDKKIFQQKKGGIHSIRMTPLQYNPYTDTENPWFGRHNETVYRNARLCVEFCCPLSDWFLSLMDECCHNLSSKIEECCSSVTETLGQISANISSLKKEIDELSTEIHTDPTKWSVVLESRTQTGLETFSEYQTILSTNVVEGSDYSIPVSKLPFALALANGEYVGTNLKTKLDSGSANDLENITADVDIKFTQIPLYSVSYLNRDNSIEKEYTQIELGTQFDVDAEKPRNWPEEEYFDPSGKLHTLEGYTCSGETIVITYDVEIVPTYSEGVNLELQCNCKGIFEEIQNDVSWEREYDAATGVDLEDNFTVPVNSIVPESSKATMTAKFAEFKEGLSSYVLHAGQDQYNAVWQIATNNGEVFTKSLPNLNAEAKAFVTGYTEKYFYKFGEDEIERKKIVYNLPYSIEEKEQTGYLGWPDQGIQETKIETRDDKEFICTKVDNPPQQENGNVEHYALFKALPYVYFVYGNNTPLSGQLICDPYQFNPIYRGDFSDLSPTPDSQIGYIPVWRTELTAETKTLNDSTFFSDLSFFCDYEVDNKRSVTFMYGNGSTRNGQIISEQEVYIVDPQVIYPTVEDTAMSNYFGGDWSIKPEDIPNPLTTNLTVTYDYTYIDDIPLSSMQVYDNWMLWAGQANFWTDYDLTTQTGQEYETPQLTGYGKESWTISVWHGQLIKESEHENEDNSYITLPGTSPTEIIDEDTGDVIGTFAWKWKDVSTLTSYNPGDSININVHGGQHETAHDIWTVQPDGSVTEDRYDSGPVAVTNFLVDLIL